MSSLFKIDGVEYPIPTLDTIKLGEAITLHEYTGLTLDQIEDVEGLDPRVLAGLVHVAIARQSPGMKPAAVREMVEEINLLALLESLPTVAEDDADPPAQTLPSSRSSDGSATSSGPSFETASEPPASATQPSSGTQPSDTPRV